MNSVERVHTALKLGIFTACHPRRRIEDTAASNHMNTPSNISSRAFLHRSAGILAASLVLLSSVIGGSMAFAGDPLDIPAVPSIGAGRLDYFAEKVRSGVPVTIGYIGGSITQGTGASTHGACYYWRSSQTLLAEIKKRGGSDKSGARLAAVGGTGSEYGACRVGIQLLKPGVDLLIIEFAVNDGDSDASIRGMEGIVRHTWRVNPKTAIVFLYVTAAPTVKDFYMEGKAAPTVLRHHQVATHYGIAEVHCGPTVAEGIKQGLYTSKEFFPDTCHPSDIGHGVYAKLLLDALLPTLDWKAPTTAPPPLPAPLMEDDLAYANWTKIEPSEKSGDWVETKPGYYTYSGGWTTTSTASMKFPVKGKKVTLVFGTSNAKIKISGLGFEKSFTGFGSAWVPPTICIYDGPTQKEGIVTIEVEPAAKGETKFDLEGVISVCRE
jgi:hypothetical protein